MMHSYNPLDFRSRADIENGKSGPNARLALDVGAAIAAAAQVLSEISWSTILWVAVAAYLAHGAGFRFLSARRSRGIPASRVSSAILTGAFILPLSISIAILLARLWLLGSA